MGRRNKSPDRIMKYSIFKKQNSRAFKSCLLALGLTLSLSQGQALAAGTNCNLKPEVEAAIWEENDQECASVTLNGKEIIAFHGKSIEEQAENLADQLQDLLRDDKMDASRLVPASEGALAAIHIDGTTAVTFAPPEGGGEPLAESFKLVNAIRSILGVQPIPQTFLKMAESQGADQAYIALSRSAASPNINYSGDDFNADFSGEASWYGGKFHGRRTSNGDRFDQNGFTAAHRTLPFGTKLLVMNRRTGDSCVVQVNDRGPFAHDRIIDLSRGAAQKLNMLSSGVAMVDCMVIQKQ